MLLWVCGLVEIHNSEVLFNFTQLPQSFELYHCCRIGKGSPVAISEFGKPINLKKYTSSNIKVVEVYNTI